jgi:hypothetical protein
LPTTPPFSTGALWTPENVSEVRSAFVDHPDEGKDDFSTKLKGTDGNRLASSETPNGGDAVGTFTFPFKHKSLNETATSWRHLGNVG